MYKIVEPIGKLLTRKKQFSTYDFCFLFNTKLTTALLLLFSVLLTALELFRTPIDCYTETKENGRKALMDNYCWSIGTYTCENKNIFRCSNSHEERKIYQRYYQWLPLVFTVQALLAYLPAYVWKGAERGLLNKLCDKLDARFDGENFSEKNSKLAGYFKDRFTARVHMSYVGHYITCKVLSILFIVVNIVMLNMVIPGFWSSYTSATIALLIGDAPTWMTYSDFTFPKMAKCLFESVGPSGSIQDKDALCLLPLNVVNQKIFVIIWMWYIFQLGVSIGNFIYWSIVFYSKNLRIAILRQYAMMALTRKQVMQATDQAALGHFFVLNQIAKNVDTLTFVNLITELSLQNDRPVSQSFASEKSV